MATRVPWAIEDTHVSAHQRTTTAAHRLGFSLPCYGSVEGDICNTGPPRTVHQEESMTHCIPSRLRSFRLLTVALVLAAATTSVALAEQVTVRMWFNGTPQEVYLTPASVPVAKTIGSPAMNLLTGVARVTGGAVRIEGDEWALELDGDGGAHVARSLDGRAGAHVVLGVRPVDLDLNASPAPRDEGGPVIIGTGPCLTAEPLGSETLYNVTVAKELVRILRYETHVAVREGAPASVVVAPGARLHSFDETSGRRLAGGALHDDGMRSRWLPYEDAEPL